MVKMVVDVKISWGSDSDGFLSGTGHYEIGLADGMYTVADVVGDGAINALQEATLNLGRELEAEMEKQTRGLA